ncbi:MAG: Zinc ABC transporter, permease protein ZnuB, partial [uncultured Quadrisphaera sp.]
MSVELLDYAFMQRALLAAAMVGLVAPLVGAFLVQRRLALVGDGLGHTALAGVAAGVLTGSAPVATALAAAVAAAVVIELVRARGRTSGDVVLAIVFYGGIAAGVVLISLAPSGTAANLTAYLFGAITTTTTTDVATFAVLAAVALTAVVLLRPWLFAVSNDDEFARASGLPALPINLVLAVLTAVTVVLSMRTVGLLLISALMVVPTAAAQRLCRSFGATLATACGVGLLCSTGGVVASFYADTPSGGTIVLLAIAAFALAVPAGALQQRLRRRSAPPAPDAGGAPAPPAMAL